MEAEIAVRGWAQPAHLAVRRRPRRRRLLQRAGFALPVADTETITVSYADPLRLLRDLRGMGEGNAVIARRKTFSRRETLLAAAARYRDAYGDAAGRMPATFQVIYLTGWAPDPSQPRALRRGSARSSLADALGTAGPSSDETGSDETAPSRSER